MAALNPEAAAGSDPNGFHASGPGSQPLETSGHKAGVLVGNDAVPEFHAQQLPAGSAPPDKTFQPHPDGDTSAQGVSAQDTIRGATSADVHTGLGHPGQGMTSSELRHDGEHHRKNPGAGGVEGRGGQANHHKVVDSHDPQFAGQRALNDEEASKHIPKNTAGGPTAEERLP